MQDKILKAKKSLIDSSGNRMWTMEALRDIDVAAEVADLIISKKISAKDAGYILKRTSQIIERVEI